MPSLRNSRWLCLFAIELAAALSLACSDPAEVCGPSVGDEGIVASTTGGEAATFTDFLAGANNDCPTVGSPTSVTVSAGQVQGFGSVVLCISRPEKISNGQPLAVSADGDLRLLSLSAELSCPVIIDPLRAFDLDAEFTGYCGDGVDEAGFSLALSGEIGVVIQCPGESDAADTVSLTGSATVALE